MQVGGRALSSHDLLHHAAYMPADRQREGVMTTLSVRENAAISALQKFKRFLLSARRERIAVAETLDSIAVKAPSMAAPISALSGGNQQKVVTARALLSEPLMVVADEPTQGVDVGARAEIYRILREVSASGIPVIVASSDAKELEGLCDQILVISRGHVVETLSGDDITEERIVQAAVESTTRIATATTVGAAKNSSMIGRFLRGDYAPSVLLVVVMLALGAFVLSRNALYLSEYNIYSMLMLVAALGFIALGQTIPLLIGGIDLSVGPLAGFLVVVASFFITDESSAGEIVLGFVLMVVLAAVVGLLNGSLIRFGKFTPIAATLVMYIALQGISLLLRATPDGYINSDVVAVITYQVGPFPVAFLVLLALAIALEILLRRSRWGWRLRAVGSDEESARRIGVKVNRTVVFGYLATSLLTALGRVHADGADRRRRPAAGRELHADQHHRRRARRHQPAGRPRHVHRHPARLHPAHPGAQRHDVPRAVPDVAVHLPGRADPRCRGALLAVPHPPATPADAAVTCPADRSPGAPRRPGGVRCSVTLNAVRSGRSHSAHPAPVGSGDCAGRTSAPCLTPCGATPPRAAGPPGTSVGRCRWHPGAG